MSADTRRFSLFRALASGRVPVALTAGAVAVGLLVPACTSSDPASKEAQADRGIGDLYYPTDGNPGYDVARYDVTATYDPTTSSIRATTRVTARAVTTRRAVDLDLSPGLHVTQVLVDGWPATSSRLPPHELVVRLPTPVDAGSSFEVAVTYHGELSHAGPISGWHPLSGGGGVMAGEPHSCAFWYPCNDHPTDKAAFHLTATVPARFTVVSNGVEGRTTTAGSGSSATKTYRWRLDAPTATSLTTILVDQLTIHRSTLPDGTPLLDAYSPGALREEPNEARLPDILAFLASRFGPYPAPSAGGMFVDARVGFSLETFGRPVYTAGVPLGTIVHENAHQWWGDNVSVQRWRDVCFNECMASYAMWLWDEHNGANLDARYRRSITGIDLDVPLYDMGPGHEFDYDGVYVKGTFFEHALRRKIGDDAKYFAALKGIQRDFAGRNIGMIQLRDQLSRRTGVDLTSFWNEWVLSTGRPSPPNLYPGTLGRP